MGLRVVHCKKDKFDIYIGRSPNQLKFGNPFIIGPDGDRNDVVNKFRQWLKTGQNFENKLATEENRVWILSNLHTLYDMIVACWCKPLACHGDVYGELLNEQPI